MPEAEFQPEAILETLARHDVHYVLIGGFAAVIHGSPYVTIDLDVVPETSRANLERLSAALRELGARVWTSAEPSGLAFAHDAESLSRVETWNLVTDRGRLDITVRPSGTAGFPDLIRGAVRLTMMGIEIDVASLADVIRSKEAAGRPKDLLVLPTLRRLLEEDRERP